MKTTQKILYISFLSSACCAAYHSLAHTPPTETVQAKQVTVPALTPAQLDASLQLTREELELDHALQIAPKPPLDLNAEIDSVKPMAPQLPAATVPAVLRPDLRQGFGGQAGRLLLSLPKDQDERDKAMADRQPAEQSNVAQPDPVQDVAELVIEEDNEPLVVPENPIVPTDIAPIAQTPRAPQRSKPAERPIPSGLDEDEKIEFQFEDADLQNLVTQIADLFNVIFITDDIINPVPKGSKAIKGNKISFKTNRPLSKKQAWNLFITFLDIADLVVVPQAEPNRFRIMPTAAARQAPIPTYIGVKPETLPDSNQLIRYLYFVENISVEALKTIMDSLRSGASSFIILKDLNAFVLTDRAYNIKSLMAIITELDRVTVPQSMSVLKLRRADAQEVKKLYESLAQGDQESITARLFPGHGKPSNMMYFSENIRIIAEPRTNALILLGPQDAIKKVEDFITRYIDVELGEETFSPLRVYPLKYANAESIAKIMNDVVQFGKDAPVGRTGGVRDGDKYLKSMTFIAEPDTNSIVVKGDEQDWLRAREIIQNLDQPQTQIAMEILVLTVDLDDTRELGAQLRNKKPGGINGLVGNNADFQTSGIRFGGAPNSFAINTAGSGVQRLLGNLITLLGVGGTNTPAGNTVVTMGNDAFGVWGIFNVLQKLTNTQVVSNPFLVATNKQKAFVKVGLIRRVISSQVVSGSGGTTNSFSDDEAALSVAVTPQINSDGMIVLDLDVNINEFTNPNDPTSATQLRKRVNTTTVVADREVLAIGGLVRNKVDTNTSKVPILGDIPILGWFFKNTRKEVRKENLLILVSSRILPPDKPETIIDMTKQHMDEYYGMLDDLQETSEKRDPIHRTFFTENATTAETMLDDFIFKRQKNSKPLSKKQLRKAKQQERKNKKKQQAQQKTPEVSLETTVTGAEQLPSRSLSDSLATAALPVPSPQKQQTIKTAQMPSTSESSAKKRRSLSALLEASC
jgi:general secretion pathway protein D